MKEDLDECMIEKEKQIDEIPEQHNKILLTQNPAYMDNNQNIADKIIRCPDCNSLLETQYSCNHVTCLWGTFLLLGFGCWIPCVVDGCKKSVSMCRTCETKVQEYNPTCCS